MGYATKGSGRRKKATPSKGTKADKRFRRNRSAPLKRRRRK